MLHVLGSGTNQRPPWARREHGRRYPRQSREGQAWWTSLQALQSSTSQTITPHPSLRTLQRGRTYAISGGDSYEYPATTKRAIGRVGFADFTRRFRFHLRYDCPISTCFRLVTIMVIDMLATRQCAVLASMLITQIIRERWERRRYRKHIYLYIC